MQMVNPTQFVPGRVLCLKRLSMAVSLALIIVLGLSADYLFRRLNLPGLVGMLLVGVLAGPYVLNLMAPQMMAVSADFRKIALIVILLRAGFELRRDTLNRVGTHHECRPSGF
jgi:NhaP-type Na+/H+ or K+/H+ antiporter